MYFRAFGEQTGTGASLHRGTEVRQDCQRDSDAVHIALALGRPLGKTMDGATLGYLYLNVTIGVPQRPFGRFMSEVPRG
jgi:hypothetical protein